MATKGEIINGAYSRLRISGLTVNPSPEDITVGLDVLEDSMGELEDIYNICLNFNYADDPDPNDESNIARGFLKSVKNFMAWQLAMFFGKQIPPSLEAMSSAAISTLSSGTIKTNRVQYPRRMARGSGNTNRYNRWQRYYNTQAQAPVDCTTNFITYGGILDFTEDVSYFLGDEAITTFTMETSNALTILSSSEDSGIISYRVQCGDSARDLETIDLRVTTDTGRIQTFIINFKCSPSKIATQGG